MSHKGSVVVPLHSALCDKRVTSKEGQARQNTHLFQTEDCLPLVACLACTAAPGWLGRHAEFSFLTRDGRTKKSARVAALATLRSIRKAIWGAQGTKAKKPNHTGHSYTTT